MSEDKMREEFEAAYREEWVRQRDGADITLFDEATLIKDDGVYRIGPIQGMWWAWQASRAALIVGLPARWNDDDGKFYKDRAGPHMDSKEVIEAIEAAGVRVKP